jgi:ABC-type antimicrobial peptide transport system permease subunit
MKPLNLRNYMVLSLKAVLPQIGLLGIKIAMFMFLCSIGTAVIYGVNKNSREITDKYVSISVKPSVNSTETASILGEIENIDGVERTLQGNAMFRGMGKLILFNTACWTFEVDKSEIIYILNSLNGRLIDGNLPQIPGEMIITRELSKSLKKEIGDYVGTEEMLHRKYKISGIYEGDNNSFIGYGEENHYNNSYILKLKPGSTDEIYNQLKALGEDIVIITDKDELNRVISNITGLLTIVGGIILLITALDVTVSVSNLNKVYFTERSSEFAILQAVGYTRGFVLRRLIKELSIFTSAGLTLGLSLGQGLIGVFYYLYCEEKGIPFRIFNPALITLALILAVTIYMFSYLPVRKYIDRMDWVEALQR